MNVTSYPAVDVSTQSKYIHIFKYTTLLLLVGSIRPITYFVVYKVFFLFVEKKDRLMINIVFNA